MPATRATPAAIQDTHVDREQVGLGLLASGAVDEAVVTFRQWAYLSPDDPAAHFQLGLALDAAGETANAVRAYRAALAALDRCDPDRLVTVLQGYERAELRSLLVNRARAAVHS
jgi:Flp pilus assembly protein TadD